MFTACKTRESRRITGETSPSKPSGWRAEAPREWPTWAIKMQWDYEAQLGNLNRRIEELETSIVDTNHAQRIAENTNALARYGDSDDVKGLTARLNVMLPNASEIGTSGVALVALLAIAHGLDPLPGSDHLYAWKQRNKRSGNVEVQVVIGYKGLLHLARKQAHFTYQSRPMDEAERAEHGLKEGELGYVTTLYVLADAIECKRAGIPYFPIMGTAVSRAGDDAPKGRTLAWVAKKNSLKDALRQITNTGTRLQEAIDSAMQQMGGQFSGIEYTGEGWRVDVTEQEGRALIAAGDVPPDDDGPAVATSDVLVPDEAIAVIDVPPSSESDPIEPGWLTRKPQPTLFSSESPADPEPLASSASPAAISL